MPTLYQHRNRALFTIVAVLGALAGGYSLYSLQPSPSGTHAVIRALDPDAPKPTDCWFGIARGPSQVWAMLRLAPRPDGPSYGVAKVCYVVPPECRAAMEANPGVEPVVLTVNDPGDPDAGVPPTYGDNICDVGGPKDLPGGLEYLANEEWTRPYVEGEPVVEVWTADDPGAPWRCACGATAPEGSLPCERLVGGSWRLATVGEEMGEGEWRGACGPHPCGDWSGAQTYYPPACAVGECDGRECGTARSGRSCGTCAAGQECQSHKCVPECLEGWECGPGRFRLPSCGECNQPADHPETHTCYGPVRCEEHRCVADMVECRTDPAPLVP